MYYVNREQIDRHLEYMSVVVETMRIVRQEGNFAERMRRFALERAVHLAVESVTDIGSYIIDGFLMRDAGSYEDIVVILHSERVFPDDLLPVLQQLVRMRKPLVQTYFDLETEQLISLIRELPEVLDRFAEAIRTYIVNELDDGRNN